MESIDITKGSITRIKLDLIRVRKGIEVRCKTEPEIEEFFKELSSGSKREVEAYARGWLPVDGPVFVYDMPNPHLYEGGNYTIGRPGAQLNWDGKENISFLRIVGVSGPEGARFIVKMPGSLDGMRDTILALQKALREFYVNHLKPAHFIVTVSSQEIRY